MKGQVRARGRCRCGGKWIEERVRQKVIGLCCGKCEALPTKIYVDARGFRDRTGNVGRIGTDDQGRPLSYLAAERLLQAISADYDRNPKGFVVAKWSRRQRQGYLLSDAGGRWIEYLYETRSKTYADHQEIFLRHVQARIGNVDVREIRAGAVEDLYRDLLSDRYGGAAPAHRGWKADVLQSTERPAPVPVRGASTPLHGQVSNPVAANGFKPKSVQSILFALRTLLNWMKRREELERVPAFPEVKVPTRVIRWITRPGEAAALAAGDVQEGGIVVCKALDERGRVKETKAGKIQFKRVSDTLFADLQAAARGKLPGAPLFLQRSGRPMLVGQMSITWRKAARKAGVDAPLYEGTRHSFATRLRQEKEAMMGRELAKEMGHGKVATTMKFYAPDNKK